MLVTRHKPFVWRFENDSITLMVVDEKFDNHVVDE
jgi:hypothetical protein